MRSAVTLSVLLFVLAVPATAWDTKEVEDPGWSWTIPYSEPSTQGNHASEHAALAQQSLERVLGHTPIDGQTVLRFRAGSSETRPELEYQELPPPFQFASGPDFSWSLYDWMNKGKLCPAVPGRQPEHCHEFKGWLGALNSTHFGHQAQQAYEYYHTIALRLASHAAEWRTAMEQWRNPRPLGFDWRVYVDEQKAEALMFEAFGQHFLQDRLAAGHMWERWGSPEYSDWERLAGSSKPDDILAYALEVGATAGLLHGAWALIGDDENLRNWWNIPLLLSQPEYTLDHVSRAAVWDVEGKRSDNLRLGAGDMYANWLSLPEFKDQKELLDQCMDTSWGQVVDRLNGTSKFSAPGQIDDQLPRACWSARVTNASLLAAWHQIMTVRIPVVLEPTVLLPPWPVLELLRMGLPNGLEARSLHGHQEWNSIYPALAIANSCPGGLTQVNLATGLKDICTPPSEQGLAWTAESYLAPLRDGVSYGRCQLNAGLREAGNELSYRWSGPTLFTPGAKCEMSQPATTFGYGGVTAEYNGVAEYFDPDPSIEEDLAEGRLHALLVGLGFRKSDLQDNTIDETGNARGRKVFAGRDKPTVFGFFNRAHAGYWCDERRLADIRERVQRQGRTPGSDVNEEWTVICALLADRFYEGTPEGYAGERQEWRTDPSHPEDHQRAEPICGVLRSAVRESGDIEALPYYLEPGYVGDQPGRRVRLCAPKTQLHREDERSNSCDETAFESVVNWCLRVPVLRTQRLNDLVEVEEGDDDSVRMVGYNLPPTGGELRIDGIPVPDARWSEDGGSVQFSRHWRDALAAGMPHPVTINGPRGLNSVGRFLLGERDQPTPTGSCSVTPTVTASPTIDGTVSTYTATPTASDTRTPTPSTTPTATATATLTPTATPTMTQTTGVIYFDLDCDVPPTHPVPTQPAGNAITEMQKVAAIAESLKGDTDLVLVGRCDAAGHGDYNDDLGCCRAEEVKDELSRVRARLGLPALTLTVRSMGKRDPTAKTDDERWLDRKVTIVRLADVPAKATTCRRCGRRYHRPQWCTANDDRSSNP
jgi:hypothetical protein